MRSRRRRLGLALVGETPAGDGAALLQSAVFWEAGAIGQVLYLEAEAAGLRGCGIGCFFDELVHEVLGLGQDDRSYQSLYHFTVGGALDDPRLETLPAYD